MDILYLLIGLSICAVAAIIAILLWAVRSGQYDDLEGPSWRVLMDDDRSDSINAEHRDGDKD